MRIIKAVSLIFFILLFFMPACSLANNGEVGTTGLEKNQPENKVLPTILSLWIAPHLPDHLTDQLVSLSNVVQSENMQEADLLLDVGTDNLVSTWVYALVAPFPTIEDEVTSSDLQSFWQGQDNDSFPAKDLLMDGSTKAILEKLWGNLSTETAILAPKKDILQRAWGKEGSWAIIPFEDLETRWKVIAIDGQSPLRKDFDLNKYFLSVPVSISGKTEELNAFYTRLNEDGINKFVPSSNREADKLTTVVLTGVTALVRGTALMMEKNGMTYPALDIGEILRDADITHISNEISFTPSCPNPFYDKESEAALIFCSKPEYIALLEAIGTDVVELTGDHFRDWGSDAILYTIDMYKQRGWGYYGGGRNLEEGQQPLLLEHHGNRIAFLGCNAKPSGYTTAGENSPGAVQCDFKIMNQKIEEAKSQGYLPIVTFQHLEYYSYEASDFLQQDFHSVADAGAVIVSGSQAHQPHAFEFYHGAFLHYGLGNLFFDQYGEGFAQRQAFIDRHIFYDGRHINTELISIIFVDLARPRLMKPEERDYLLADIFFASGW
ncbi:MAG TPA: hypothetical protein G4N92_04190 [Anaerolineae bacterium]|nr:hypothetical protein [Anaerolineae bacterium]